MNKLVVLMLAASALAPASAIAQRTAAPPVKWEDTPHAQMRMPMPPNPPMGMNHGPRGPMAGPGPNVQVRHFPGPHAPGAPNMMMMRHRGAGMMMRHHGVRNYSNYRRFDRGFVLPHAWWGPQFQISNWGMYGLPQPIPGGRWVRYYDDALMLDGYGRVLDGRWGMSWDQWGDQWDYDDSGVPVYVGGGDYYPDGRDYAWTEGAQGGPPYGPDYAGPGDCRCAPPPPPPYPYGYGPGYGYGYGWGWGYGGAVVVTETTVTTAPSVVTKTYYEEEVVRQKGHKVRKYRAKPRYYRPVPQPGERG